MQTLTHNGINPTINFNEQLMAILCEEDSSDDDECLISGEKLKDNFITLNCSHTFNYCSIFEEIKHQKKINHLEITKLKNKEIKCPYCRRIQQGILPWEEGYEKIKYVNWPMSLCNKPNECCHILKNGKRKGQNCGKKCYYSMCKRHLDLNKKAAQEKKCITCNIVLKSGKRKGLVCNAKIKNNNEEGIKYQACNRHLKFLKKNCAGWIVQNKTHDKSTNTIEPVNTSSETSSENVILPYPLHLLNNW